MMNQIHDLAVSAMILQHRAAEEAAAEAAAADTFTAAARRLKVSDRAAPLRRMASATERRSLAEQPTSADIAVAVDTVPRFNCAACKCVSRYRLK